MNIKHFVCISLIATLLTTSFVAPKLSLKSSTYGEMSATGFLKLLIPGSKPLGCPSGISYGETIGCSIVSNETDSYTFTGSANDRVVARLQITSGNIDPTLQINDPGGPQLCISSTIFNLLELSCVLASNGTHTIHVSGSIDQTGAYNLHLQRSNDPANQTAIAYGQTLAGNVTVAPEMDAFGIDTEVIAGDTLVAHLEIISPNIDPHLRIYHDDGTLLCEDSTIFSSLELICNVSTTGNYTVLAFGGDNQSGSYEICINNNSTTCGYQVFLPLAIK